MPKHFSLLTSPKAAPQTAETGVPFRHTIGVRSERNATRGIFSDTERATMSCQGACNATALYPELFPPESKQGFRMKDQHESARLGITIRRIKVNGLTYTVRPSFVTPYLTGLVSDVENALFFRKFSVPFWALAHVFGKNPMYWYRLELSVGRHELVGTTVRHAEDLPDHLDADEKHTRIVGSKVYVASTCGGGCILGAAIAQNAGEAALTKAYEVFKTEAENVKSAYAPKTVNTDGWPATQKAWRTLFCGVILIACFLHVYIKLRDRSKMKFKEWFQDVSNRLWRCYVNIRLRRSALIAG